MRESGFSLAETLLALALAAVAILALLAVATYSIKASQKSENTDRALSVAETVLDRLEAHLAKDQPAGVRDSFWAAPDGLWIPPWNAGQTLVVERTSYRFTVEKTGLTNQATGQPLGTGPTGSELPNNRVCQLVVMVEWWDESDDTREEFGRLQVRTTRLLKESQ